MTFDVPSKKRTQRRDGVNITVKARSFEEALQKGEKEAMIYAAGYSCINPYGQRVKTEYMGGINVYEPFDKVEAGCEIYSVTMLFPRDLSNEQIGDCLFGKQLEQENQLRKVFLNRGFLIFPRKSGHNGELVSI